MTVPAESSATVPDPLAPATDAALPAIVASAVAASTTSAMAPTPSTPDIVQAQASASTSVVASATTAVDRAIARGRSLLHKKPAADGMPQDPRDWITPEDLNVAPTLLGLPLATPWQRAKAMAIDLILLVILSNFGNTLLLAGCCWVAWRWHKMQRVSRGEVKALRGGWLGWAPALCVVALGLYSSAAGYLDDTPQKSRRENAAQAAKAASADPDDDVGQDDGNNAGTSAAGASHHPDPTPAEIADVVKTAVATATGAAALAASDAGSGALAAARPASDTELQLKAQRLRIKSLEAKVRSLRDEARRTPIERMKHWWDLVGLNLAWAFGWFVLWPMIWPGQTPGKRLMGLQVVELTGKPMKPMLCVRRYGGYAAGMATGGMGFLQILWDGNRQGMHDKAAHTAVVDLGNPHRLRLREDLTG
ncbi:RDD family protein [Roseateles aquatilis]|nr:RDD family protein [Roseateles aquatilis]